MRLVCSLGSILAEVWARTQYHKNVMYAGLCAPSTWDCGDDASCMYALEPVDLEGDLNRDGQITTTDILMALQITVSGGYRDDADMDWNGCINTVDALVILQSIA